MVKKIILLGLVLLGAALFFRAGEEGEGGGQYDQFAQCLTDNGATMYGAEWCSHCQEQKRRFGGSFEEVDYVNCELQRQECLEAGVQGYPTWIVGGERLMGTQTLQSLAQATGCSL